MGNNNGKGGHGGHGGGDAKDDEARWNKALNIIVQHEQFKPRDPKKMRSGPKHTITLYRNGFTEEKTFYSYDDRRLDFNIYIMS